MSGRSSNEKHGRERKGTGKRYSDSFLGFVDIDLNEKDKEELGVHTQPGQVDISEFILQMVADGYKVSVVADTEHSFAVATATGKSATCENKGYALSGRGPDALSAIVVLWYKVAVKANWGPWVQPGADGSQQLPLWR